MVAFYVGFQLLQRQQQKPHNDGLYYILFAR